MGSGIQRGEQNFYNPFIKPMKEVKTGLFPSSQRFRQYTFLKPQTWKFENIKTLDVLALVFKRLFEKFSAIFARELETFGFLQENLQPLDFCKRTCNLWIFARELATFGFLQESLKPLYFCKELGTFGYLQESLQPLDFCKRA